MIYIYIYIYIYEQQLFVLLIYTYTYIKPPGLCASEPHASVVALTANKR